MTISFLFTETVQTFSESQMFKLFFMTLYFILPNISWKYINDQIIYANPKTAWKGNVKIQLKFNFGFSNRKLVAVVITFAHRYQKLARAVR